MIRRLERQLQEKENEIKILKEQKSTYTKQLETNEETIEEYKTKYVQYISVISYSVWTSNGVCVVQCSIYVHV